MYTNVTSRPPLEMDDACMRGNVHYLIRLPGTPDVQQLTKLIAGNQLAVSSDGYQVAMLVPESNGYRRVMHTGADLPSISFHSEDAQGKKIATRILWAGEHSALVWGRAQTDAHPGIWLLLPQLATKVMQFDQLTSIYGGGSGGMYSGTSRVNPGQITLFNRWGCWPVQPNAQVTMLGDGTLLVLESYEKQVTYAYRVGPTGRPTDFTVAPLAQGERPVQLLSWDGRFVLAGRSEHGSWLREFGSGTVADSVDHSLIQGDLEAAWNAPNQASIALLTRIRTPEGVIRRLYLNSKIVYEGPFMMEREGLQWSPSGTSLAAVVQFSHEGDQNGRQAIVTPGKIQHVSRGKKVRSLVVRDSGQLAGMILSSGHLDHPYVGTRSHDSVSHAWNLHLDDSGAVIYNSINGRYLFRWEDTFDIKC
jgi:hypothetical protein